MNTLNLPSYQPKETSPTESKAYLRSPCLQCQRRHRAWFTPLSLKEGLPSRFFYILLYHDFSIWEFPKIGSTLFGCPYNKGSYYLGKLLY